MKDIKKKKKKKIKEKPKENSPKSINKGGFLNVGFEYCPGDPFW